MKLKCEMTIAVVTGGSKDEEIRIEVSDNASGTLLIRTSMSMELFGKIAFGHSVCDVDVEYFPDHIGLQREFKWVEVFIPRGPQSSRLTRQVTAIHEYEVDGWVGDLRDADNHHHYLRVERRGGVECDVYRVGYVRYVAISPSE